MAQWECGSQCFGNKAETRIGLDHEVSSVMTCLPYQCELLASVVNGKGQWQHKNILKNSVAIIIKAGIYFGLSILSSIFFSFVSSFFIAFAFQ
jgi:hypothetical protein